MLVEVQLEGELEGVGVGVGEVVLVSREDWVVHILLVLQIQWNYDLHMNKLSSITHKKSNIINIDIYLD